MSDDLGGRLVRGAALKIALLLPARASGVALTVLVGRWLTPELYGLYGLALIAYGVSELATNPSTEPYFIRTPSAPRRALDSAWTLNVARGLAATLFFWALAHPIASALDGGDALAELLRLLSPCFAILGLKNPHVVALHHALDYRRLALYELAASLAGAATAITALAWTRAPAGLALGYLVGVAAASALSWVAAPRLPRLAWDVAELKTAWRFSRFLLLNGIILFGLQRLDDLIIGALAGAAAFGVYSYAYEVLNKSVVTAIVALRDLLLPAFTRLLGDRAALCRHTASAIAGFAAIAWLLCASLWAGARPLFALLAPDGTWDASIPVFLALTPFVLVRAINGVLGSLMLALGQPHALTLISGTQLALLPPAVWIGYQLGGLIGVSLAIAVLNLGAFLALLARARRAIGLGVPGALVGAFAWAPLATIAARGGLELGALGDGPATRFAAGVLGSAAIFVSLWALASLTPLWPRAAPAPAALWRSARAGRGEIVA